MERVILINQPVLKVIKVRQRKTLLIQSQLKDKRS